MNCWPTRTLYGKRERERARDRGREREHERNEERNMTKDRKERTLLNVLNIKNEL